MPHIVDLVEPALFQQEPPRPLPLFFRANLLGEYLLELPWRVYLDVPILAGVSALIALRILDIALLPGLVVIVLASRIGWAIWRLFSKVHHDSRMIRYGSILPVEIIAIKACTNRPGVMVHCRLPIHASRQSVGSIYLPDQSQAERLAESNDLRAICLPRAPGTWRLLNVELPGMRYERELH